MSGAIPGGPSRVLDTHALLEFALEIDQHIESHRVAELTIRAAVNLLAAGASRLSLVASTSGASARTTWETPDLPATPAMAAALDTVAVQAEHERRCVHATAADCATTTAGCSFILCAPVLANDRLLGSLAVAATAPYSDDAERFLQQLAAQTGRALLRTRTFEAFRDISRETVQSVRVQHSLESVFTELKERGFEFAIISAVDQYRGVIETMRCLNIPPEWTRRARHTLDSDDIQSFIVRTRQTEVVVGQHPRLDRDIFERFDHGSLARVFVPVIDAGEVVGTIEAGCPGGRKDEVLTVANLDAVEAIAVRHSRAIAQARPYVLLKLIAGHAIDVLGADSASLHVYEDDRELLVAGAGRATVDFLRRFAPRPRGLGRLAMSTGEPRIQTEAQLMNGHPTLFREGVQAMVAVPLLIEPNVLGVLYVHFWQPHRFTSPEVETVKVLARHMEVAIQNALLMRRVLEITERVWTFSRLQNVIQAVASGVQLQQVLENVAQTVLYAFGADNVTLYQYLEDEDKFEFPPVMKGHFVDRESMLAQVRPDDVVWHTVKSGEARFTDDVRADPMLCGQRTDGVDMPRFVEREDVRSSAALVLRSDRERLGIMFVNYHSPHTFGREEQAAMNALASSAAIAIKSVRLRERVDREAGRRMKALEAMKAVLEQIALHKGDVVQQVLDLLLDKALEIIGARIGIIMWYNHARGVLVSRSMRGFPPEHQTIVQSVNEGVVGEAARTLKSILVPNVRDERWRSIYKPVVRETVSELAVPLADETGLLGVLNLEDPKPRRFSEEDRALLEALVTQAASAVHSVRLYSRLERQIQPLQFLGLIATRARGDLDMRLRMLLTGITAKQGLGFSRAMLFLLDPSAFRLEGMIGIGARTGAEADRVWREVERLERDLVAQNRNFPQALLDSAEQLSNDIRTGRAADSEFSNVVRSIVIPVDDTHEAVARCVREKRTVVVRCDEADPLRQRLHPEPEGKPVPRAFACVPIMVEARAVGALVVDNAFLPSECDVDKEATTNLEAFAEIAGMSIAHSRVERLESWRTFMQGTGHLFGSRIAIISAVVRKLRASLSLQHFTELNDGVSQMQRLLADFGRFIGDSTPAFQTLDVGPLVRATVGAHKASTTVPIELTVTGRPLLVFGDHRALANVLTELVENAEEAMEQAKSPSRIIRIRAAFARPAAGQAMAELEVADTGPGIPDEHKKLIFQPLFTTKERASGLGLMGVWDTVEQHKGTIAEVGVPGTGACFVVRLPLIGQ